MLMHPAWADQRLVIQVVPTPLDLAIGAQVIALLQITQHALLFFGIAVFLVCDYSQRSSEHR